MHILHCTLLREIMLIVVFYFYCHHVYILQSIIYNNNKKYYNLQQYLIHIGRVITVSIQVFFLF